MSGLKRFTTLANPLFFIFFMAFLTMSLLAPELSAQPSASTSAPPPQVMLTDLEGPIGPASADHIRRAINRAENTDSALLIIRINTPGGLDNSMRDIVSAILASPVPVATWVAPSGARAASAGTYILAASHIAAMAPATNVGSSTPINLGRADNAQGNRSDAEQKAVNDAIAYLQGLQELRGRNMEWAVETVGDAANLSAPDALQRGVVDLIARDVGELVAAVDGRSLSTSTGAVTLNVTDASIERMETNWRHSFLNVITNPNIAYILLMIGVYGLILEFYTPGLGFPGVTGIICLLVAAYALQMLPVSYVGLALMAVGIGLIVFEVISPSFGVFGLGGVAAFVLGSVMLMDTDSPAWQISLPLIAAFAVATGALVLLVLGAAIRARQRPVVTGQATMAGMTATAMEDFTEQGHVQFSGEIWKAKTDIPVLKGERLHIRQVEGLLLHVSPERQ